MVFFNYSAQQMAAKIVYYGPGLGGKTTNLQYIYDHTTSTSRGKMVSLETDTDRTLFFDLLPIEVGSIGGFDTRLQLYTVPGQVFYNTTRKLVLKGVDGVVFVADSQRPMIETNIESLKNLEENLGIVGINMAEVPMVLQLNKRDLPNICTVAEMTETLNRHNWPVFEASALSGQGIFETLTGISKLTISRLRARLSSGSTATTTATATARPAARTVSVSAPAAVAAPPSPPPAPVPVVPAPAPQAPDRAESLQELARKILHEKRQQEAAAAQARSAATAANRAPAEATAPPTAADSVRAADNGSNGHVKLSRTLDFSMPRKSLLQAHHCSMLIQFQDADDNIVGNLEQRFDLSHPHADLSEILLSLNVSVQSED